MALERNSFKMGTVEMLILSLLSKKDLYGYEIASLLKEWSSGSFEVPEGTLYPVLYKLEDRGHIASNEVRIGKRRIRKYYQIKSDGEKRLQALLGEYRSISEGIDAILAAKLPEGEETDEDNTK